MIARNNKNKELLKNEKSRLEKTRDFISKYFSYRSKIAQRMYIFILTLGLVTAALTYNYAPDIGIELGRPSPRTIKATRGIEFEDVIQTEEDRNRNDAAGEAVEVY